MNMLRSTFAALMLVAMPARAMSLFDAGQLALSGDPRAAAASSAVDASAAGIDAARAGLKPSLSLGASTGLQRYYFNSNAFGAPFPLPNLMNPTSASLRATQSLYSGGETGARVEAAKQQLGGAEQNLDQTREALLLSAATSYLNVVRDRAVLRARRADLQALNQAQTDARKRYDAGEATKTDTAQADARVAMAQAELKRADATMRADAASFERVVGMPVPDALDETWPKPSVPGSLADALRLAGDSPAVQAADAQHRAALAQIDVARAGYRPKLSLEGDAGVQADSEFAADRYKDWSIKLKASLPLYQGGAVNAQLSQARADAERAAAQADDTRRAANESITQSWAMLQAADEEIAAYQSAITANELAFDSARKELQAGTRTTLDVLDAERDKVQAEVQLASSRRDRAVAAYQLLYACGTLKLDDLR